VNVLAFDTSTTACSVALAKGDQLYSQHKIAPMKQAGLILPMIQELLDSAGMRLNDLDALAFGCGPGSFTGIRIASSVAQGIGFAYSLPIIHISTLAAIAEAAYLERQWTTLLVAVDARMEQVYWAVYEANQQGIVALIGEEKVYTPGETILFDKQASDVPNWFGVGDGWGPYKEQLIEALGFQPQQVLSTQTATAEAVLMLAKIRLNQGERGVFASDVAPIYLR